MADDIVTRLREIVAVPNGQDIWTLTALNAADEIERLRALVDAFVSDDDCYLDHGGNCQQHNWFGDERCPHARAKEARRG